MITHGLANSEMGVKAAEHFAAGITALYRVFLGREPEPPALAYYMEALAEGSLDARSLITVFQNCDEHRRRQHRGHTDLWVPPGHYYSPIVNVEELRTDAARVFDRSHRPAGVDLNEAGQLALLPVLRSLAGDLPFQETKKDGLLYYFNNPSYGHGDAVVLACMIRHLRPRRILEFGCGFSSCVILDINRHFFGGEIECTFVDPYPQLLRDLLAGYTGDARIMESRAQDIDLDIVRSLHKDDILFIDSTHVSKAGSDVNFHFFETLPALQAGVFIHFHDVAYPFEYPEAWFFDENRSWNELYLLRAFLMYNPSYRIEFFNHLLAYLHPDLVKTIPWFERNCGGAIWLRKCDTGEIVPGGMVISVRVMARGADLGTVEDRSFSISGFRLQNGTVMPQVKIAYETYGRLAADGRNAVLIAHGYTSSHHAAGRNPANGNQPGWWDGLIGPGKAIDTDKLFVVSSNMLGSSFGSTNGASINPDTGKPYGPDFPAITVHDIVRAEKALLDGLGVKHLVAVAGPSYGGYQAFQWAVSYPDFMDGIIAVVTAPKSRNVEQTLAELQARLAADPEWNGGWYYDRGGAKTVLTELRVEMLKRNGIEAALAALYPDQGAREAAIRQQAADWAKPWDANSLVILRRGTIGYDTIKDFAKIKAKILYVLCRTDRLFPPSIAPAVMSELTAAGIDARYFEIDSELGHSASGPEHAKWSPVLRRFLDPLTAGLE